MATKGKELSELGSILSVSANTANIDGSLIVSNSVTIGNSTVNATFTATSVNANTVGGNTASDLRSYSDTVAGTAYSNAATYAGTVAGTAYSNATTYADNKAANAYSNAVSYAGTIAGTAYTNATSYAATIAGTAYSNGVTYTDNKAANAYSNATTFASNATNISSGTLAEARLPFRMDQNVRTNDSVSFGSVSITGNLTVTGTTVTINTTNLTVDDNMIYLNEGTGGANANPDLGFAGAYNDGTYRHAGFFRDASDGVWKVYDQYLPEPDASPFIDTANASFRIANFQANVVTAASFSGNGASVTSVDAATVGGNTAGTLRSYSDSVAGTAYTNAVSSASSSAATAYSNAISYFTSNYTASDVLTKIKTVDGTGSGLDADTVDGYDASSFALKTDPEFTNDITTSSGQGRFGGWYAGTGYTGAAFEVGISSGEAYALAYNRGTNSYLNMNFTATDFEFSGVSTGFAHINTSFRAPIFYDSGNTSFYVDPAGSSNIGSFTTNSGYNLQTSSASSVYTQINATDAGANYAYIQLTTTTGSGYLIRNRSTGNSVTDKSLYLYNSDGPIEFVPSANISVRASLSTSGMTIAGSTVWHAGNDGSGSGLDADLLDGYSEGGFAVSQRGAEVTDNTGMNNNARRNGMYRVNNGVTAAPDSSRYYSLIQYGNENNVVGQLVSDFVTGETYTRGYNSAWSAWRKVWDSVNDGSGSGLDADLLDGQQGSYYAAASSLSSYLLLSGGTVTGELLLNQAWGSGTYNEQFIIYSTYPSWTVRSTTSDTGWLFHTESSGNWTLYSIAGAATNNWTQRYTFNIDGTFRNGGSGGSVYWHAGNDGSGSGLDADLLDGQQGSYYNQSQYTGTSFISTDSSNGLAIDSSTYNNVGYVTTASGVGSGYSDGSVYTAAYSSSWVSQIYADYRSGSFWTRTKNSGTWQSWNKLWAAHNDGSGSGLDADLLDGLNVHSTQSTQNNANQIVRTNDNGYTMLGWINTTSGDSGIANRLTRIYSSYDEYVRYSTLTDFKVHMGLSAKNNYSRRIDYTADPHYHVGSFGHSGYGANETFHGGSGFFDIWSGTNYPSGFSHIHGINMLHYTTNSLGSTGGNAYGWQLCTQYDSDAGPYWRRVSGGGFTGWRRIWHDTNDGSGSGLDADLWDGNDFASYLNQSVRTDGTPTFNTVYLSGTLRNNGAVSDNDNFGLYFDSGASAAYAIYREDAPWSGDHADLRIAFHTGIKSGGNPSYGGMRFYTDYDMSGLVFQVNGSSNYLFKYYWMYTNTTGFYSDTNGAHLQPNTTSSYGQWLTQGNRNSYGGIYDLYSAVNGIMYDSGGNGGVYREANGRWYWYHNVGNNCMGIGSSSTSSSYYLYVSGAIYSTGNIVAYSDSRKKENIVTVDNALDKVNSLRGVFYNKIDDEKKTRQLGVIAQEINEVVPEVVTYAEDVDEYGVSYGNLAGLFIEAFKEQTKLINSLKEEIELLKNKLETK